MPTALREMSAAVLCGFDKIISDDDYRAHAQPWAWHPARFLIRYRGTIPTHSRGHGTRRFDDPGSG